MCGFIKHLSKTLHPILVSTFLDNAPAVFSPGSSPSETETNLVLAVARLARCMYRRIASDSAEVSYFSIALPGVLMHMKQSDKNVTRSDLETLLNHMFPYFPFSIFTSHTSRRDIKVSSEYLSHELH